MIKQMLILILLMATTVTFGQNVSIDEAPRSMSKGTFASYMIRLPDVSQKEAEKAWLDLMKEYKNKKTKKNKSKEWYASAARIPSLSDEPVQVYAQIDEQGNETIITTWFELENGFVGSDRNVDKSLYAKALLSDFAASTSKSHANMLLDEEEKQLKRLEKDLDKLKKDNEDYHKKIREAEELIQKMKKNIQINESDQVKKASEIEFQRKAVDNAKAKVRRIGS